MTIDIRELTKKQLQEAVLEMSEKSFRANQIWEWLWKKCARSFDDMTSLPIALRNQLAEKFQFQTTYVDEEIKSIDKTAKLRFLLHDGQKIEGVIIPSLSRTTACISTQAGCPLGCGFCATGKFGFQRNLSTGEIFDQVAILNDYSLSYFKKQLTNIVIMGMGEPFLNFDAVMNAIDRIKSPEGLAMSPKRITLSTAGLVPEILRFADINNGAQLAISLHSANQLQRERIMPIAKKYPLKDLIKALEYYHTKTGDRVTIEYLLMSDVNDTLDDARELAAFCKHFPVKVNLIHYNEVPGLPYKKPSAETVADFGKYLEEKNIVVNIRRSRGDDIAAACGQLANEQTEK